MKELIKNNKWEELLKEDQLIKQRNEHKVQWDDLLYKLQTQGTVGRFVMLQTQRTIGRFVI